MNNAVAWTHCYFSVMAHGYHTCRLVEETFHFLIALHEVHFMYVHIKKNLTLTTNMHIPISSSIVFQYPGNYVNQPILETCNLDHTLELPAHLKVQTVKLLVRRIVICEIMLLLNQLLKNFWQSCQYFWYKHSIAPQNLTLRMHNNTGSGILWLQRILSTSQLGAFTDNSEDINLARVMVWLNVWSNRSGDWIIRTRHKATTIQLVNQRCQILCSIQGVKQVDAVSASGTGLRGGWNAFKSLKKTCRCKNLLVYGDFT